MSIESADPCLLVNGVNKTLAHMISNDFCFKAAKAGIIERIDQENEICILAYLDGTKDAIDISDTLVKNSNGGFYTKQNLTLLYKEGEHFDAGDVIAANKRFFSGRGKDVDYQPGVLAKIAIAPGDWAFEDSTLITDKLAYKCKSKVTMLKPVVLGPNAVIHNIAKKGDAVNTGDHLLDFTTSFEDESTTEFLKQLAADLGDEAADMIANDHVTTKYSGKVVDVKIHYNVPFETLSESLQKLISDYSKKFERRRASLGNIKDSSVFIPSVKQLTTDRVGSTKFEGVLIEFYVEYEDVLTEGDKITFQTALKGVVSKRVPDEQAPISENRPEDIITAILTPSGVVSRMTQDIFLTMGANKVLVELGYQINEIMNDER